MEKEVGLTWEGMKKQRAKAMGIKETKDTSKIEPKKEERKPYSLDE